MMHRLLSFAFGTALLIHAATLAQVAHAEEPQYGGTLIVALSDDPPTLDPHLANANAARTILHNIFATLVETDEELKVVPELAETWEITPDGLEYTFYLREDVIFHDGTPFNAEAVKYNFERMLDPEFGSARGAEVGYVQDVVVEDEFTVRVTLSRPFAAFLPAMASWAGMMVSPTAAEEHGDDFGTILIGAGPFKFVEAVRDDRVVIDRFDDYFKEGLPYLDRIIHRPFVDADSRIVALETGAIHMMQLVPGRAAPRFQENPDITLSIAGGLGFAGFWLNTQSNELGDRNRRAAVSACIDRETLVNAVYGVVAVPGISPFSPATWVVDETDEVPSRDLDLARRHLAEAGVPDGFTFTLLIVPDEESIRLGSIIAAMCEEVGITINLQQVEFGAILSRMTEGNYQAAMIGLSPRTDPDLSAFVWFHSTAPINFAHYGDPDMDALLEAARNSVDQAERREFYRQAIGVYNRDFPYIFTHHIQDLKAFVNEVRGYVHNPDSMMRFESVWLEAYR